MRDRRAPANPARSWRSQLTGFSFQETPRPVPFPTPVAQSRRAPPIVRLPIMTARAASPSLTSRPERARRDRGRRSCLTWLVEAGGDRSPRRRRARLRGRWAASRPNQSASSPVKRGARRLMGMIGVPAVAASRTRFSMRRGSCKGHVANVRAGVGEAHLGIGLRMIAAASEAIAGEVVPAQGAVVPRASDRGRCRSACAPCATRAKPPASAGSGAAEDDRIGKVAVPDAGGEAFVQLAAKCGAVFRGAIRRRGQIIGDIAHDSPGGNSRRGTGVHAVVVKRAEGAAIAT